MQRTFDDLGTPLSQVTFCVVDLETTGGSADRCGITEVGAVKVRGGEFLGTFQSLVNPGVPIPPEITVLTGITQAMVLPAPRIEPVLAAFEEFSAGTVIVGHNVRFDLSFLAAARRASGWAAMTNPWVDTCALAAPVGARRGAELPAVDVGQPIPPVSPALAPGARRRTRHH